MSRTSAAASTRCCSRAGPVRPTTSAAPTSARNRGGEAGDRADRRRRVADRVRHRPPRPRPSLLARLREAARRARLGGAGPLRRGPGAHRAVVPRERGVVGADPLGRIPRVLRAPVRQSAGLMPERLPTKLDGVVLLEPEVHGDARGFMVETYRRDTWGELGVDVEFVQHNHSRSSRGTLRGIHFQTKPGQAKLVPVSYTHLTLPT